MTAVATFKGLKIDPAQVNAVSKLVRLIHRFGLVTPAILTLESVKPLSVVGAQTMHLLSPVAATLTPVLEWDCLARLLDDRRGLEYLIHRIEHSDREGE